MKFFIDTADGNEIRTAMSWGCISGVTTNPSLYEKTGLKYSEFNDHIKRIASFCKGMPVSVEVVAHTVDDIIEKARKLHDLAENIVIKLPICTESLAACRILAAENIPVNMTLIFSAPQALLAARAGASYISPFVGRFDDASEDGIEQLETIVSCLRNYRFDQKVEVIAASIRNPHHVTEAALIGADIVTVSFAILKKCVRHPLTAEGLVKFERDWQKVLDL